MSVFAASLHSDPNHKRSKVCLDPLVEDIQPSATLEAQVLLAELKAQGKPTYDWGLGASPFPVPEPLVQALRNNAHKKQYTPPEGIPELAQTIARFYSTENYLITPENVLVATGLKQLIFDAQRSFGGEIIHVCPFWVSYQEQTKLLGKEATVIYTRECNNYKLTPDEIRSLCIDDPEKPRMMIFNHPINPTGGIYSQKELMALAEEMNKYNLIVFADEVYLGCEHNEDTHSISEFLPNKTVRAASLSKKFSAGGWRLGWATFPQELSPLKKAMAALGSSSYSCAPVPEQYAALEAFKNTKEILNYNKNMRFILRHVGQFCAKKLRTIGLSCSEPEASWYLLINFENYREHLERKGIHTSGELVNRLIKETGIVFVAAEAFGLPEDHLSVRASYVNFSGAEAMKDSGNLDLNEYPPSNIISKWTSQMNQSVQMLETWLTM